MALMTSKALVFSLSFVGLLVFQKYLMKKKKIKEKNTCKNQVSTSISGKKTASITLDKIPPEEKDFIVEIEYCTGCRWMLRAAWLAQELLTTFQEDLRSVQLTPNSIQGGIFQVYLHDLQDTSSGSSGSSSSSKITLWSRKISQRFPESKELKQIVRDFIKPDKTLGHSDKKE
jgi:selenoprotein W-related protein